MTDKKIDCENCIYCYLQDYGYSNYTVEGTEFYCLKRVHPDGDFDRFYGKNPRLKYAEKCDSFEKGECLAIDCDQEEGAIENYTDNPEIIELYNDLGN